MTINLILISGLLLSIITNTFARLIPPTITNLGCGSTIQSIITESESCNRIIKGTGVPGSTISIYSTHYLEKAGSNYENPNQYVNLGSLQNDTTDPLKRTESYIYPSYYSKIINGTLITDLYIENVKDFVSSELIELYLVNDACLVTFKENGKFMSIGISSGAVNINCASYTVNTVPIKDIQTSMANFITLDESGTVTTWGYGGSTGQTNYRVVGTGYKKIFAGGFDQFAYLDNNNYFTVQGYDPKIYIWAQFTNVDPRFVIFSYSGGGFIDSDGQLKTWGQTDITKDDFPHIIIEGIQVDSKGNWEYEFSKQDNDLFLNTDSRHLQIQSFYQNSSSGIVTYPDSLVFFNNIDFSIPSPQFIVEPDGYISGKSIPNSQISIYSIGEIDFDFFGPVQYGCNIGACAYINNGAVTASGESGYGGDITSVKSFVEKDIVELYVIYNGAFVAVKQSGELITWGSYSFGGGKYLTNIVQISTSKSGFVALFANGEISLSGQTLISIGDEKFIQVYAGGTNIYAGLTLTNKLYVWTNGQLQIHQLDQNEKNNGIGFSVILTDWVCGIIYDDEKLVTFTDTNNYIDEMSIPWFITNQINTDSTGYFKYKLTSEQINNFNYLDSVYLAIKSQYSYMDSSMVYSSKLYFEDQNLVPTSSPTLTPTNKPTTKPTINPTNKPSINPTNKPSIQPTNLIKPTNKPTRHKRPCDTANGDC